VSTVGGGSVYKVTHCRYIVAAPTVLLKEFPRKFSRLGWIHWQVAYGIAIAHSFSIHSTLARVGVLDINDLSYPAVAFVRERIQVRKESVLTPRSRIKYS
jgi:hypothetical protein